MEFVYNDKFDNYVEKYKQLPLEEKKIIVQDEFKELLAVLSSLNEMNGKEAKILFNHEVLNSIETQKEDGFVESMFVYINSIKESLAPLLEELKK